MRVLCSPYRFKILFLAIGIILFSCNGENQAQEDAKQLEFHVDKSLLDSSYTDPSGELSFYPPKGWKPIDESTLKEVKIRLEMLSSPEENIRFELIQFFLDSTNGNSCALSRLHAAEGESDLRALTNSFEESLQEKFPETQIKKGEFKIGKIEVVQFLVMIEEKVIFKLVFSSPAKSIFQMDYAIARAVYPEVVGSIESSIGSLTTLYSQNRRSD